MNFLDGEQGMNLWHAEWHLQFSFVFFAHFVASSTSYVKKYLRANTHNRVESKVEMCRQ